MTSPEILLATAEYYVDSPLPTCELGGGELCIGETVVLTICPIHPDWPEQVKACVDRVQSQNCEPGGRLYTLSYCVDELNGGPEIRGCDILRVDCPDCCEEVTLGCLDCSGLEFVEG